LKTPPEVPKFMAKWSGAANTCRAVSKCRPERLYKLFMTQSPEAQFAAFVATLGRGPGRSRDLTREEAETAFGIILRGEADPHQVGAFLMLLRFRGEDAEEITGLVQAARVHSGLGRSELGVDLDWPSYGAGRTRGAPWFLLAAMALARSGITVLMHGSNDFSAGIAVEEGLAALGMRPETDLDSAAAALRLNRYAYLPLRVMAPEIDHLLDLRRLFGLRSPVNTVARLLNPADAPVGVDGVFHPPYIDVHLGVAERMKRRRLLVLKGGGGEAERVPLKPGSAAVWDRETGRTDFALPAVEGLGPHPPAKDTAQAFAAVWTGDATPETPLATIRATIGLALLALGRADDPAGAMNAAAAIWAQRR
jgi:anthranilate phosphoribosyltransferase